MTAFWVACAWSAFVGVVTCIALGYAALRDR